MTDFREDIRERILYEDNHLIIVNKRAGEIVQGDKTGDIPLLEKVRTYLKETYSKPNNVFCGLVHRIDRPVSGIVIFAKTSKALSRMNELIKNRQLKKIYRAIVDKELPGQTGKLTGYLWKNEKQNKSYPVSASQPNASYAELNYRIMGKTKSFVLLEIELITGRHHQIRAQLSEQGAHIKGDLKYGAKRSNQDGSISLHAARIEFEHPVSHEFLVINAIPPQEEFRKIWDNL